MELHCQRHTQYHVVCVERIQNLAKGDYTASACSTSLYKVGWFDTVDHSTLMTVFSSRFCVEGTVQHSSGSSRILLVDRRPSYMTGTRRLVFL